MIEGGPLITMVAPCSPPSRTLRAGFAGAASGILDGACAPALRRPAGRDEGMVPCGRTKGWSSQPRQPRPPQERRACCDFVLDKKGPIQGGASSAFEPISRTPYEPLAEPGRPMAAGAKHSAAADETKREIMRKQARAS